MNNGSKPLIYFRLWQHSIWLERPGVVSEQAVWVCYYDGYMHIHHWFIPLIWNVLTEYKHDRHAVG